jgi:hypothetical protein
MVLMVSVDDVDVLQKERKWYHTNKLNLLYPLMNSNTTLKLFRSISSRKYHSLQSFYSHFLLLYLSK